MGEMDVMNLIAVCARPICAKPCFQPKNPISEKDRAVDAGHTMTANPDLAAIVLRNVDPPRAAQADAL